MVEPFEVEVTHTYGLKVGTDSYHHDGSHPSRLILPEVP